MQLRLLFTSILLVLAIIVASAQSIEEERVSIIFNKISLEDALNQLDELIAYDLAFDPKMLSKAKRINVTFDDYTIRDILDYLIAQTNAEYNVLDGQIIISKKKNEQRFTISGYVEDQPTKEKLAYATLYFPELELGVTANEQGYYSIKLPKGSYTVHIGYVGRDELSLKLIVEQDTQRNFELSQIQSLAEVIVTPDAILGGTALHRSFEQSDIQSLALNTPAVGGESDVLQIVRNLAGIESNAGDVGSMFVRGGEDDHNLVLMDGVPIYYPSHLLGMYSIFNAESVRNIEVYKGGFPARYGGKLAAVIDIQTKEGRTDGWHADISTSYESMRGSIQGAIGSRISLMLGGRKSIASPFLNDVIAESFYRIEGSDLSTNYNDFNFKLNAKIGQRGKLTFSGYSGTDFLDVIDLQSGIHNGSQSNLKWKNSTLTAAYHQEIGNNSFLKVSHTYNSFLNEFGDLINFKESAKLPSIGSYQYLGTNSDNDDVETKISLDHYINPNVTNRYGISYTTHSFKATTSDRSEIENGVVQNSQLNLFFFKEEGEPVTASSTAIFFEQERKFSSKFFANMGLRLSGFVADTRAFEHLEPRLNLKYLPTDQLTINLYASKMVQYIHQISDANLSFPKDIWLPSNDTFKPSTSWQFGGGFNKRYKNKIGLDVQVYYTEMENLNYVFDIYNLGGDQDQYADLENFTGLGVNMGLEITTEIPFKKLLWVNALTIAKSRRQFTLINDDQKFPFQFDRRAVLKSALTYQACKKLTLGSRIYVGSATPEYFVNPTANRRFTFINLVPSNSENSERAKAHYRLDLSATLNLGKGKVRHQLKANLYNVLNRKNSGFTYRDPSLSVGSRNDVFALPFIPSLHYNLSF